MGTVCKRGGLHPQDHRAGVPPASEHNHPPSECLPHNLCGGYFDWWLYSNYREDLRIVSSLEADLGAVHAQAAVSRRFHCY